MAIVWDSEKQPTRPTTGGIVWDSGRQYEGDTPTPEPVPDQYEAKKLPSGRGSVSFGEAPPVSRYETFGDTLAGVTGGVKKAGLGLAQGMNYLSDKATAEGVEGRPDFQGTKEGLDRSVGEINQELSYLKDLYGKPGFGNPVSWGEFTGETGPFAFFPAGRGIQAARTGVPGIGRIAAEGAGFGAVGGATAPLEEGDSRGLAIGIGTGAGAVFGPAVKGVTNLGGKVVQKGADVLHNLEDKYALQLTNPAKYKEIYETAPLFKALDRPLRAIAPRSSGQVKSREAARIMANNDAQAIVDLTKLRNELPLTRETGKLPQSQEDLYVAVGQGKTKIMDWLDEAQKHAEMEKLVVDIRPIIKDLYGVANNPGYNKAQRDHAKRLADEYSSDLEQFGEFTPQVVTQRLAGLNNDLKSFFGGTNPAGDSAEVVSVTANRLRRQLNETMDGLDGSEFSDLRKMWGRFNGLEERVLRGYEQRANKLSKTGVSMLDVIGYQQFMHGHIFQAAGTGILKSFRDYITSPDPKVRKMFNLTGKNVGDERITRPVLTPRAPTPQTVRDISTGAQMSATPNIPSPTSVGGGQPYVAPRPTTMRDPSTGATMSTTPNIPGRMGNEGGQMYQGPFRDPTTGANMNRTPAAAPRMPSGTGGEGVPYRKPVVDPTTGAKLNPTPAPNLRIPSEYAERFPGMEKYFDPAVGAKVNRMPSLKVGQIYKGWIYIGGNPAQQSSWRKP